MSCACGMDSVGTCLACGARLCPEHALRGRDSEYGGQLDKRAWTDLDARVRALGLGVSVHDLHNTFPISLNGVRSDLRPLFRFQAQRQAFFTALRGSGVICGDCRINGACEAAGATQPTALTLGVGGSQRLRDAVTAYLLGDQVAWDSMASDAALKDALFQDLIHLAREKAERFHVPVEWEARTTPAPLGSGLSGPNWTRGEVRATEEVFYVVDVMVYMWRTDDGDPHYAPQSWYMNRYGQWGSFYWYSQEDLIPDSAPKMVTVKTGLLERLWSGKRMVFRVSWSDKRPFPGLRRILERAAKLLAPGT